MSDTTNERWHVLVVDDEPANLEIIAEFLSDGPFVLNFAGGGGEALRQLGAETMVCDIVILDRMMPGIDGIEVLRRLKSDARWAITPVIMQTAAVAPEQVREGLAAGAYYYLTKPYRSAALLGIIWAAIDDLRRIRALGAAVHGKVPTSAMDGVDYAFSTLEEVDRLAVLLGAQCPEPEAVAMGLAELLLNAVEHGNLAISYAEKVKLKLENHWRQEVERRLWLGPYRERRAVVRMERESGEIRFIIRDQGNGFDWRRYLEFDAERAFAPNGRGIALARKLAFQKVEFQGCGNIVVATVTA